MACSFEGNTSTIHTVSRNRTFRLVLAKKKKKRQRAYRHAHGIYEVHICWLMKAKVGKDSLEVRLAYESLRVVVLLCFFVGDGFGAFTEQPVKTAMDDDQVSFGSWTRRCDFDKIVAELGGPNKVPQP